MQSRRWGEQLSATFVSTILICSGLLPRSGQNTASCGGEQPRGSPGPIVIATVSPRLTPIPHLLLTGPTAALYFPPVLLDATCKNTGGASGTQDRWRSQSHSAGRGLFQFVSVYGEAAMSSMEAANNSPRTGRWKRRLGVAVGAISVVAVCIAIRSLRGPVPADAKSPPQATATTQSGA